MQPLTQIPDDYGVVFVTRQFRRTWIYQLLTVVSPDNCICSPHFHGVQWMQKRDPSNLGMLYFYLRDGWPDFELMAKWDHENKSVQIFADDLRLCPTCGEFDFAHFEKQKATPVFSPHIHDPLTRVERPTIASQPWSRLSVGDAQRVRSFACSRLTIPEIQLRQCADKSNCEARRRATETELKRTSQGIGGSVPPNFQAAPSHAVEAEQKETRSYASSVYLFHGSGHYKIGIARNVESRLQGIRTSCPFPVEIIKKWKSEDAWTVERQMHKRYAEYRLNGEWFKLPEAVLADLKSIRNIDSEFLPPEA